MGETLLHSVNLEFELTPCLPPRILVEKKNSSWKQSPQDEKGTRHEEFNLFFQRALKRWENFVSRFSMPSLHVRHVLAGDKKSGWIWHWASLKGPLFAISTTSRGIFYKFNTAQWPNLALKVSTALIQFLNVNCKVLFFDRLCQIHFFALFYGWLKNHRHPLFFLNECFLTACKIISMTCPMKPLGFGSPDAPKSVRLVELKPKYEPSVSVMSSATISFTTSKARSESEL